MNQYCSVIILTSWVFAVPTGAGGDSDFYILSIWYDQGEPNGLFEVRGYCGIGYQARVPNMFLIFDPTTLSSQVLFCLPFSWFVKDKFGVYVTDSESNASLTRADRLQ